MNMIPRLRQHLLVYALALAAVALSATAAYATHFRYGTITWSVPVATTPNVIRIRFDSAWRWSYPWGPTSPPVGTTVAGSAGTMVIRNISTNAIVANTQVYPRVTSINASEDWFAGEFEWQVTLPSATQNYRIEFESCCRISSLLDTNNDTTYRVWAGLTVRVPPATINRPPVSSSLPVVTLARFQPSTFAIAAFDPDGDSLTFSIPAAGETGLNVAKPATLSMSPSGVVTWTPTVVGPYAMQVRVADGQGAYTPVDIIMNVINAVGQPPTLRIDGNPAPASFSVVYGNPVSFLLSATDPENKAVQLTTSTLPLGSNMSPSLPVTAVNPSSTFTWVPTAAQVGSYSLSFAGLDADGRQATISAQISVTNNPPTITCTPAGSPIEATGPGGASWSISADVDDPDGGNVSVRFFVDGIQRQLNGTNAVPSTVSYSSGAVNFALGSHTYEVRVSDGVSAAVSCSGSFSVVDTTAPSIQLPADITVDADSPAGTVVNYPAAIATDIADLSPSVACVLPSGTEFPVGTSTVVCTATDASGNTNSGAFTITVRDITAPVVTPVVTGTPGNSPWYTSSVNVSFTITDPESSITSTTGCDAQVVTDTTGVTFTCSATNAFGLTGSADVTVQVDTVGPTLGGFVVLTPTNGDGSVEATSPAGAAVDYTTTSSDATSGVASHTCSPASGSTFGIGVSSISCMVVDAAGNQTPGPFSVTVVDTTAPNIAPAPGQDFTIAEFTEATSAAGATVNYQTPQWADIADPSATTTCVPASGSVFALGQATITCTSTDVYGNSSVHTYAGSTVRDTTAPVLTVPTDIVVFGDLQAGKVITFAATATDAVTVPPNVSCLPASGSTFPYGTTTVSCTATDNAGNSTSDDFTVTVNDPTPPVVTPVISGTLGNNGWYTSDVVVTWTVVDPETAVTTTGCDATTVNSDGSFSFPCSATSAGGTTSADATGKRDATAPVVATSANLTVTATSAAGAVVTYMAATAIDATSPPAINVSCAPVSGSTFAIGTTVVTCTASDQAGNEGTASFTVSVSDTVPPVITSTTPSTGSLWPPNHQMVPVTVSVAATDNVTAAPACTITGVTSNEPQNGLGDGDTPNDWQISGLTVQLRSERSGKGDGRTYTIAVECSDSAGNTTASSTTVSVPKSQKK